MRASCIPESSEGEVLLPDQFFASRRGDVQPLRRLMVAVLREAIGSFQRLLFDQSARGRRLFTEVEGWLMAEDEDAPLRFEEICAVLGLDPGYIRQGLRGWRAREMARARIAEGRPARRRQPAAGTPACTAGARRNASISAARSFASR